MVVWLLLFWGVAFYFGSLSLRDVANRLDLARRRLRQSVMLGFAHLLMKRVYVLGWRFVDAVLRVLVRLVVFRRLARRRFARRVLVLFLAMRRPKHRVTYLVRMLALFP